ncbi:MAG TPA: mechanosensitive ion channel family protein [Terriglobia bacterium]|nr:mechanosensitive ion channel family protein [Terriglobia bacterium]
MRYVEVVGIPVPRLLVGTLIVLIYLMIAFLARRIFFSRIARATSRSRTRWDDVTVVALKTPSTLLIWVLAGLIVERYMELPVGWAQVLDQLVRVVAILALILFAYRFLRGAVELYQDHLDAIHLTRGFARAIVRVLTMLLGGLIVLDTLHISITPLLASLGVGGLAVGLALQGTLSNLFAGMQIISDRPIRVGDYVRLDNGQEGYVTEIGWRATKIRMLPNNTVVIPNSKLAESVLTNYYLPEQELAVLVEVGVSYNSDLHHVERVTTEVAREIQRTVPGAVADFEPFVRFHTFEASSINFSVIMRAHEYVDNFLMKHEFIKRLHERYKKENIVIPWPIRTLDISPEVLDRLAPLHGPGDGNP